MAGWVGCGSDATDGMVPIPTDVPALQVPGDPVRWTPGRYPPRRGDGVCVMLGFSVMAHNLLDHRRQPVIRLRRPRIGGLSAAVASIALIPNCTAH